MAAKKTAAEQGLQQKMKVLAKLFDAGCKTEKDLKALTLPTILKIPDVTVPDMTVITELRSRSQRIVFSHTWEVEQMSQATRPSDRHIIWSNQSLDVDDWREDYKEFLEANELDDDPNDEQALYEWMEETNYEYLSDERVNLNVQLSQPIIVIGDIGRWNGRVMGYKDIPSGNIKDCLYADTDYTEWYVDKYGDLRADATHHDGTNHYLYRVFKDGVSETQMENLRDKIYHGKATRADITRLTRRLGDEIAAVYGFDIPKQRTLQERGAR